MTWDIGEVRLVTASAYPGLMGSLLSHPSTVCVLSGDADSDALVPATVARQSVEVLAGVRRRWQTNDVTGLSDFVPKVLADRRDDRRPLVIVAPRVTSAWQSASTSWPEDLRPLDRFGIDRVRIAEDKTFLRHELRTLGVPVPESLDLPALAVNFARVADCLGTPFVMQAPNSAGGQGTYLVTDQLDLSRVLANRPDVASWLISGYAGDITLNVSGVVYHDGVRIMPASVQSSGIPEVGSGFGAFCGSDFGAAGQLPATTLTDAYGYTTRVAEYLREVGYRGIFGADIALAGSRLAFLEVNPRIQGSSWLLDSILGGSGVMVEHVRAILGGCAPADRPALSAIAGSQLIVRWTGVAGIVRTVGPGWRGPRVMVTGLPLPGTVLQRNAIVARIRCTTALADPGGTALTPDAQRLVAAVLSDVRVTPL